MATKPTALILSGGGARAAYQVGVLKAISDILPTKARNPFPIICGTSAGAINGASLATHAARFRVGVLGLEAVWRQFHVDQVYRSDPGTLSRSAWRWASTLFLGGLGAQRPQSLLDNAPLAQLLERLIRFERIRLAIEQGDLSAFSVTCSNYASGESVSFFEGQAALQAWQRSHRIGISMRLRLEHLLASSAIPGVFPAVCIDGAYFGDGSVRQLAPISPALHLGAERVLVIGVSGSADLRTRIAPSGPPSIAQVAGHVLDSAFVDSLAADLERLERINRTLALIPDEVREASELGLRPVEALTIAPSRNLDEIARDFAHELPRSLRFFLRGSGGDSGSALLSYLLFEPGYCQALIELGYEDAMRREHALLHFLGYDPVELYGVPGLPHHDVC